MSGANAIVAGRCVNRTSSPRDPAARRRRSPPAAVSPRQAGSRVPWSCSASAAASVTGRLQAKLRQTYAVGRPSMGVGRAAAAPRRRPRGPRGPPPAPGSAATSTRPVRAAPGSPGPTDRRRSPPPRRPMRERRRYEPLREPRRVAGQERRDRAERPFRGLAIAPFPGPCRQPQEHGRRHRPTRGDRVVLRVLRPGDQSLVVARGVEEATRRVGEPFQDPVGEPARDREPALIERGLVQRQQTLGEVRVVLEHPGTDRATILPRPLERPIGSEQPVHDRRRRPDRRGRVALVSEQSPASARAAMASPFQAASALSSRAGWALPARRSSRRARRGELAPARRRRGTAARRRPARSARGSSRPPSCPHRSRRTPRRTGPPPPAPAPRGSREPAR